MERKKRSKGSGWECCYANKIFGTFGVEMRSCGQKLVKFCTLTHAAKLVVEKSVEFFIDLLFLCPSSSRQRYRCSLCKFLPPCFHRRLGVPILFLLLLLFDPLYILSLVFPHLARRPTGCTLLASVHLYSSSRRRTI